jgi:hypothetical protein
MQSASFPARHTRKHYRHELRTLTYVTLDDGNGGIVRNLSHEGVAVQAVARLRQEQPVRLRFELRFPRLRVEAVGQVSWTNPSGQCGIRFVDLSPRMSDQIDEWIFSNLLDSLAREADHPRSIFGPPVASVAAEDTGMVVSAPPRPSIRLEEEIIAGEGTVLQHRDENPAGLAYAPDAELNWLSRPLSPTTLAWMVDSLIVIAALLLFALIFLSVAHELPRWQLTLSAALGTAIFIAATYRILFSVFGGPSLGTRLVQALSDSEAEESSPRFR